MGNNPLVSVLMTAYNRQQYIGEAIESVLASGYTNFELIIVDDCSADDTLKIAREYETKDNRVKVYLNENNLGDYPNRNRVAGYANGKYLKYVDSDDKIYPGGLEYCVQCMEKYPDAGWGIFFPVRIPNEYLLNPKDSIRQHFFKQPFLKAGPGGTIIKKDFFLKVGGYPVLYGPANDMYFNLKAASMGKTLVLKDIFLFYRIHEGQEQNNRFSYLYNNYRYLKDALQNLNLLLATNETLWLEKKLKRRFTVNIIQYFLRTFNLRNTKQAVINAGFSFKDFLTGVFHFKPYP